MIMTCGGYGYLKGLGEAGRYLNLHEAQRVRGRIATKMMSWRAVGLPTGLVEAIGSRQEQIRARIACSRVIRREMRGIAVSLEETDLTAQRGFWAEDPLAAAERRAWEE